MPVIVGLGLAAAAYPQLLAIVIVILTRPEPRRLLWACYVGALSISVGCGLVVLFLFRDRHSVVGSTSHRLGASPFIIGGALAIVIAVLIANDRSRGLLGGRVPRIRRRPRPSSDRPGAATRWKASAHGALARGSAPVAVAVGAVLGVPGPFDLLAYGRVVRAGYAFVPAVLAVLIFTLIKLLLIELPIVSYALQPEATAHRVERFSSWMKANQIRVIAGVIAVIGVVLVGRGISRVG